MKSKKLLFSTLLMLGGVATYITMSSNSQGIMGKSTVGCGGGGCHGAMSTNTLISFSGTVPSSGYVPGSTYTMTLLVANASAKPKSGFDLTVTGGSISGAPANTMAMGTELHHTSPLTALVGGGAAVTSIVFNWTAPTSAATSVTFNVSGNAVDGTGNQANDEWNQDSYVFNKASTSINDVESTQFNLYPNPATEYLTINTDATIQSVKAISLTGSMINLTVSKLSNNEYRVDTKTLATGAYVLLINDGKSTSHKKFIKQ